MSYPNTQLLINGKWVDALDGATLPVVNPASGQEIGRVAKAGIADLDLALVSDAEGLPGHGSRLELRKASRAFPVRTS